MENLEEQLKTTNFYLGVIGIIGIGFILNYTQSFMIPFVIAALLSILFSPLLSKMSSYGISEAMGSLIIFIGIFVFFTLFSLMIFSALGSVVNESGKYSRHFEEILHQASEFTIAIFEFDLREEFDKNIGLLHLLSPANMFNTLNSSIGSFVGFFSNLIVMLLFLMFMMLSRDLLSKKICDFLDSQSPEDPKGELILQSITEQIRAYLWLKTLISAGTGIAVWLLAVMMGLDFPVIWGFLAFILNYIPSIGPIIAATPPIILAFFQFSDNPSWALMIALAMILIQFSSGNIIEPKLMGDRLNLNILVVLLCLFVWGLIWGFSGMILSIPLTASLNIIFHNSEKYKRVSELLSN